MVKSKGKGMSKGKRYTRRRVKGGNTPLSKQLSIDYGFPNTDTKGSPERGYGFPHKKFTRVNDIDIDDTLYDSASPNKNSGSKKSLPKTSVWDGRVDYLKQREQYIESQNNTIKDLNNKITNLKANNPEEKKLLQDLSTNITQMTNMVNNRKDNVPQNEKKATENLSNMFRDQINFLYFYKNAQQIIGQINKLRGRTIKPPKKPWWNITRKNKGKTGEIKQIEIIQLIKRTAYGKTLPNNEVEKIAQTLKGQTMKNIKKNIKRLTLNSIKV